MMEARHSDLQPTYTGYISTTLDALILFEACLSGHTCHVPRRPHDRERQDMIKSGHVFVYEEHSSGIKRWTDGAHWSPSRILGNFLIYREMNEAFAPGEKKRAMRNRKSPTRGVVKSNSSSSNSMSSGASMSLSMDPTAAEKDQERALVGSLVDSYKFKTNGLVKKTISILWNGVPHHLVSYYNCSDVTHGRLLRPSQHPSFVSLTPRSALVMSQNFRSPIHEFEWPATTDGNPQPGMGMGMGMGVGAGNMAMGMGMGMGMSMSMGAGAGVGMGAYHSLIQAHDAVAQNHARAASHVQTTPMPYYPSSMPVNSTWHVPWAQQGFTYEYRDDNEDDDGQGDTQAYHPSHNQEPDQGGWPPI
jgi:hypothetical protein